MCRRGGSYFLVDLVGLSFWTSRLSLVNVDPGTHATRFVKNRTENFLRTVASAPYRSIKFFCVWHYPARSDRSTAIAWPADWVEASIGTVWTSLCKRRGASRRSAVSIAPGLAHTGPTASALSLIGLPWSFTPGDLGRLAILRAKAAVEQRSRDRRPSYAKRYFAESPTKTRFSGIRLTPLG